MIEILLVIVAVPMLGVTLIVFLLISVYNRIVALNERADQAFADMDVQLRQRHDLVPNLVETVKGFAAHESETLEAVIAARGAAVSATGPKAQSQAEGALGAALVRVFSLAESYPDLKANTNFLELQRELGDIENKIAAARRFFNNAVQEFNTVIQQVPGVFVAPFAGHRQRDFFEIAEADRAVVERAPQVKF